MKIAHISDPHFFVPNYSLSQFLSKRWLGNLNLLLNRKSELFIERLCLLPLFFKSKGVTDVVISGDLTTTSSDAEFEKAQHFVQQFENEGIRVTLIPGNHDNYTRAAGRGKTFYKYFPSTYKNPKSAHPNLRDDRHTVLPLENNWTMVLVDTSVPTPLHLSTGNFSNTLEQALTSTLTLLEGKNVILVNHYPFISIEKKQRRLVGAENLFNLLKKFPCVRMYWHGHTHRKIIADLRESKLPVVLDPGSISYKQGSFFISDLTQDQIDLKSYHWRKSHWIVEKQANFTW
ncbi:hypothetical protein COB21_01730 [Candidatus Aerophobetes bacterium]|uniref:Calcineurin-like phosphoesterase domain-containing protein n=1 Tax=Aerophobetes bacterium TaxID=2030807 RepID=A0A2A4X643_UNCAE|nr:MAG: hypothetical protein COB21_01730 [Candidatus Aerophobetes bacterium]